MDNTRYINLGTYEIEDSPDGYIPCDKEIADVIAVLNKKNYLTTASCGCHNTIEYDINTYKYDIGELDRVSKEPTFKILEILNDHIIVKKEIVGSSIYISFKENYDFKTIPEGYTYDGLTLRKRICFYDEGADNRKQDEIIDKEIMESQEVLRKWANSLND